ncbi:NACHT domain- and WD repeat-containing protein 1 [Etheostoma cragini]|uniref:NACHT domain- and WD repeat-containing protein 1 n=1 Tax=Etheostoma cragini TaxID=417921 RepID=UPI00155E9BAB|nr:NACHT domain- and WD repeat-containing protein 1 [Etheostoma cragini]
MIIISRKNTGLLGNRYGERTLPRRFPETLFQLLLSKLSKNREGAALLTRWFLRDDNAVPPAYVLQPITAHFPPAGADLGPQRDAAALGWRDTETTLLQLLRSAAAGGGITAEQKQELLTSVLDRELDRGLLAGGGDPSALLFVREIPRQRARDGPKRLARFLDLSAGGVLDADAQRLLGALRSRLLAAAPPSLNLHSVELCKGGVDAKRRDHAQYLDAVCREFVSQMKAGIATATDGRRGKPWGSIADEKKEISDGVGADVSGTDGLLGNLCGTDGLLGNFCGREGLLGKLCCAIWESTNLHHGPLVVHGAAGAGKTALLCRLAAEMRSVLVAGATVVVRLLAARHPHRPDVHQVLRGVCLHICLAAGLAPPPSLRAATMPGCLRDVLAEVSRRGGTLLIVLDAVDHLSDRHVAHKLRWLPTVLPPNVHLLVSMDTDSEAFANMRLNFNNLGSFFEVERLSADEGRRIAESNLRSSRRTLTAEQSAAALRSFESTGSPLHLRMILSAAKRWASFTPLAETRLGASTQEMMSQLFMTLEENHGKELVGGALGYIALAREGLLEAELRDIMSLDDDIISGVYRDSLPPTPSLIRFPPLLWARLRRDIEDLLEERWTHGVAALAFNTRRLSEAVSARYLTSERRGRSLRILAEYFLGRWSGRLKPVALPGLTLLLADRKVPPQPLWFAQGLANVRKLQELPYHLLHAGLWDELRQEVIGSAEWLFCKSQVCGLSSVIQDLDQCSQYLDCSETSLIRDALVLIEPSLDLLDTHMDMSLFYTELLARLCSLATPFPSLIGRLCSHCEEWLLTSPDPSLVPKCSFLPPPGGALQHTLTGLQGGVLCVDVGVEAELLVAGSDAGVVAVWSLADKQLLHLLLGHTGAVLSVKVMASSARCLSLAADGSLRGWSLADGQQLLCVQEALPIDSAPSSVHLHLSDQMIFVYTRTQVKVLKLDGAELFSSSSCNDEEDADDDDEDKDGGSEVLGVLGESVVSLCASGLVRIFHPIDGSQTVETRQGTSQRRLTVVESVTLPRRGKVFVVSKSGFLHQISKTGKWTANKFPLVPSLLSVTEDEKILLAGSDHTLSLFNIERNSVDGFLDLQHDDSVLSACVSSDSRLLVSGAADQLIRIWSVTTGALLDSLCGSDTPVTSVLLHHRVVVSASTAAPGVLLWNLTYDPRHKPPAHVPAGCAHVAVARDADRVFYVRDQSQTEVISWDINAGCMSEHLPVSAEVCSLELAQDKRLLFCGLSSGTVLIYPLALPLETLCIPPPPSLSRVLCVAVGGREKHVAVAYEDSVGLFRITNRDQFPTVEGPLDAFPLPLLQAPLSAMALLSDRRLLYGTRCGQVKLHDFVSGSGVGLETHRSSVSCVVVGNHGNHALVGSEDAVQRLWALNPLVLEHTMEYKGFLLEGVLCAAFSENDQFVFTGSQDRTIKVWDVTTGNLLQVQPVHSPVVKMETFKNGLVALSQQGSVIREVFHCPDQVRHDYNPLRNVRAQYRVTSRDRKTQDGSGSDSQNFNPAQLDLDNMGMLRDKPSAACRIL